MKAMIWSMMMLLVVTACSNGSSPQSSSNQTPSPQSGNNTSPAPAQTEAPKEDITLRIAWWGGQERADKTMKVLEMYTEANPHVSFETEFASYDAYFERLTAQAAGNNLPDITFLGVF